MSTAKTRLNNSDHEKTCRLGRGGNFAELAESELAESELAELDSVFHFWLIVRRLIVRWLMSRIDLSGGLWPAKEAWTHQGRTDYASV